MLRNASFRASKDIEAPAVALAFTFGLCFIKYGSASFLALKYLVTFLDSTGI